MYAIETEDGHIKSAAKGVSRHIKEKVLSFVDFKKSLFENEVFKHQQVRIGSSSHKLYTIATNKVFFMVTAIIPNVLFPGVSFPLQ